MKKSAIDLIFRGDGLTGRTGQLDNWTGVQLNLRD